MSFVPARPEQLGAICALYQRATADMQARGLNQWQWGIHPREDMLAEDIALGRLYVACEGDKPACAFALTCDREPEEPEYAQVDWRFGTNPAALHRVAVDPEAQRRGWARRALAFAKVEARRLGYDVLRMDTFSQNERAMALFTKGTERRAGEVFFAHNTTAPYVCFEERLRPDTPLLPIAMRPAYRHGDATPWGGARLKALYGKHIPDDRTGEALEISAIPGLNSVDAQGVELGALIARYGKALTGKSGAGAFPLLLKLIDAHDKLSVQVHPNDAYARANEGGKLGKSEAWVILHAEPDAAILYGMKDGVTKEALQAAVDAGEALDGLIRRVPVKAGDVFYIQSGMTHAIGAGIVLYEIQQSSDVTYRFWDYDRANAKGEKRPLHLKQGMDVVDVALTGLQAALPAASDAGLHGVLRVEPFALLCACVQGELPLPEHPSGFRMLTALEPLALGWQGGELALPAGRSVLIPALAPALTLRGAGRALIAHP